MLLNINIRGAATLVVAIFFLSACGQNKSNSKSESMNLQNENSEKREHIASDQEPSSAGDVNFATFGAGCFWCVEAVFQRLDGVISITSGYSGGTVKNPSYKDVCSGSTGHAEVCQITYDKTKISFDELLEVFWKTHDPTTINRQGNDIGTQYRSAIFYHSTEQRDIAEAYKKKLNEEKVYPNPIITEIKPFTNYYPAEDYHQNYYNQNAGESYCQFVIQPKLEKFEKVFKDKMKK